LFTSKLLKQGYRQYKLRKYLTKVYNLKIDFISKFKRNLKTFLRQGIRQPDFYRDVIYKLWKILGHCYICIVFTKSIKRFIKIFYDPLTLRHTACLVFNLVQNYYLDTFESLLVSIFPFVDSFVFNFAPPLPVLLTYVKQDQPGKAAWKYNNINCISLMVLFVMCVLFSVLVLCVHLYCYWQTYSWAGYLTSRWNMFK
jgi:hypothetical protein